MTNSGEHLSKYKMFRNFMYNELGITKDDIKEWVKEAVANETAKLVGQIAVDQIASRTVRERVSDHLHRYDKTVYAEIIYRMMRDSGYSMDITRKPAPPPAGEEDGIVRDRLNPVRGPGNE
ncbi:MAG: hypothetical protein LBQ88_11725 [Treponema sp.]|jgi:hypothetical protein|nr:hypothetical protein [Treponema sp.]